MVKSHSSVGIVLYHAEQDALLVCANSGLL